MKIKVKGNSITGSDLFRLVWRGWFIGVTLIFVPIILLAVLSGMGPNEEASKINPLFLVVLLPLVAALQGVFIGGMVLLGNIIRPTKKVIGSESEE